MKENKEYYLFWVDRYSKRARVGPTHAAHEDSEKTLCGLDFNKIQFTGGSYHAGKSPIIQLECKKCLKALNK